jgi:hypothetical protein
MSHKQTPYPFDGMPDEDYFGELVTLSSTMGYFEPNDNLTSNKEIDPTDTERKPKGAFSEFSRFPVD